MKIRALAVLAVAGLATVSNAQPIEALSYSVEWDFASINNGGTNTGGVYATITPDIGTQTAWNTVPGKGQAGILKAFASSIIALVNNLNGLNGNIAWTVPADMNLANIPGVPDGLGGITNSQSGQFGPPTNPTPNLKQKVLILALSWTDTAGGNYSVDYGVKSSSGKVWLDVGLAAWVGENAVRTDGKGGFNVVPAPASLALLGLGGLIAGRRRR
jgi:hypothetical protein